MKRLISALFLASVIACTGNSTTTDSFVSDEFVQKDIGNTDNGKDQGQDGQDTRLDTYDIEKTQEIQDVTDADIPVQRGIQPLSMAYTGQINAFCRDLDGNVYAVGTRGYCAIVRNGNFLPLGFPKAADLTGCAIDGDRMYVSGTKGTVFMRYQGEWKDLKPPDSSDILGIGAARDTVYTIGRHGRIMQWTQAGWRVEYTGVKYDLHAIWFSKAAGPFVVGTDGMMLYKQGKVWISRQIAFPTSTLYGIYRDPSGLIVVVGNRGLIVTSNNNDAWQVQVTNESADPPRDLHAVYGLGPDSIYVAGEKGAVFWFNGHRWTAARPEGPYNTDQDLFALTAWTAMDSTDRVLVMGSAGKGLFFNGKKFVDAFANIHSGLRGLSCDAGRILAVGQGGVILSVKQDSVSALVPDTDVDLYAVSDRYAVGAKGGILDMKTLKLRTDCNLTSDLNGVMDTTNGAMAVGQGGVVVDIGDPCVVHTPVPGVDLNSLAALSDKSVIIVGDYGKVILRKHDNFTLVPTGLMSSLRAVAAYGSGALIVGDNGTVLAFKNQKITIITQKPAAFFYGIAVFQKLAFIAGWAGDAWLYDGSSLTEVPSNTPVTLNAACQEAGRFIVAGDEGYLGAYQP